MASDASRRWLDETGIWSCRIKIPHPPNQAQAESSRATAEASAHPPLKNVMAPADPKSMDTQIEGTSPSSRRNKGKLAEAIQNMGGPNGGLELDLPTDPDAQATVTDFLDFTEYLPADMVRSLTLIGNLDQKYTKASMDVNDLTRLYGQLPSLPAKEKREPTTLRGEISQNLEEAVNARTASYAEACRMVENVERHYNRIKAIYAKLKSIADAYPPSREASPAPQKAKSPTLTRAPKITLHIGRGDGAPKVRKHRAPRITVPGEVLAPYELDYESYGSDSDGSSDEQFDTARETLALSLPNNGPHSGPSNGNGSRIKLKVPKRELPREKKSLKPPKETRPPGFGTNVHSQVAGISTSNALRLLEPPPPEAKLGDPLHLPWLALSDYELGLLRKKMKKNAVWSPSDTMINRELKIQGRGIEAYKAALEAAQANGEAIETPPQLTGQLVTDKGALSTEAATKCFEEAALFLTNRGMQLNEAKKLKRKMELEAAEEELQGARTKVGNVKAQMQNLFVATDNSQAPSKDEKKVIAKTPSKTPARKRKREPDGEGEGSTEGDKPAGVESAIKPTRPLLKRSKTETPVPLPQPIAAKQSTPALSEAAPSVVSEVPSVPSVQAPIPIPTLVSTPLPSHLPTLLPAPVEPPPEPSAAPLPIALPSPKKSSTPILPPAKDLKKPVIKKEIKKIEVPTATSERPRRGSTTTTAANTPITPAPVTTPVITPVLTPAITPNITPTAATAPVVPVQVVSAPVEEVLPAKRPTSSFSKAASAERQVAPVTTAVVDRPRRTSTARNTPAPQPEPRQPSKRTKRPAPGIVTKGSEDSTAVSVGKRSAATRKKAGPKKEKKDGREGSAAQEIYDEIDDEGNIIDPKEPRYCVCNRVSFGTMIGCENADVDSPTFRFHPLHAENLTSHPPRKKLKTKANKNDVSKCEKEWFHLECVHLDDIPPRTTKWYCPDCRITLGIGEKGEVNARGRKK
ncbi:hypothetical protein BJ875DRAFT_485965 [Amylocarpus encephaloides]|uniref:Inhibitor of growth protein N-terminal histone-binding domain-containing protein n=1 Tax=Amylocarpus encephaloides TaxID=45428 RepID=A0A9P7YFB0_9HELO|nr:hypothetical protein BJ875DRAFT_485965 [Amylocarpus encephaloides]